MKNSAGASVSANQETHSEASEALVQDAVVPMEPEDDAEVQRHGSYVGHG